MKRKLVNLLIDVLLDAFSFVLRLKDDSPGIPVTNFRELAEVLAREDPIGTPAIRPADMLGTARHFLQPQDFLRDTQAVPSYYPNTQQARTRQS
jgi:hypothetical protein